MDDRDLVQRSLRGDPEAYRQLVTKYRNTVYGLAISYTGDFDLAEDLAQEAFIRAYYRLNTLADGNRFRHWLHTIILNLCRMELRKRNLLPLENADIDTLSANTLTPEDLYLKNETHRQLTHALDRLSQNDREAVVLYYLQDERVETVAQSLGISPDAVKGRLYRARQKLRKEILAMAKKTIADKRLDETFVDRIDIRSFADWALLKNAEIQQTLRETETQDLAVALQGKGKEIRKVEKRVMANMSERVQGIVREFIADTSASPEEIEAAQKKILRTILRLQTLGRIRSASRNPTSQQFQNALQETAETQIAEYRHGGSWTPREKAIRDFMPYLAAIIQKEGIVAAAAAFEGIREPVFQRGLKLLAEKTQQDDLIRELEKEAERELASTSRKYRAIVHGMAAILEGKKPEEIAKMLSGI
ncbi:MAG: sigma-70 family RNA polymerase sigma factor [bacterium]|nr:sigma-70 family RNA polymerase sigma factor [bacterium]